MTGKTFFDTNVLIYAFSSGDARQKTALSLLLAGGTIGVQTLNEFARVMRWKYKASWPDVKLWLGVIEDLCPAAVPLSLGGHRQGLRIAETLGYQLYDSMMLAAAIDAECDIFYSEDLRDGHTLYGMTIRNPFTSVE